MSELKFLLEKIIDFRDARDWKQFHNPKDLALQVAIEAGELLEEYLWKSPEEAVESKVQDELADVLISCFLLADHYNFDVASIINLKLKKVGEKYPIEKAKGRRDKYDTL
jgi:NTP pyrophosphatase (non-canonical NTP hydrolase)